MNSASTFDRVVNVCPTDPKHAPIMEGYLIVNRLVSELAANDAFKYPCLYRIPFLYVILRSGQPLRYRRTFLTAIKSLAGFLHARDR